MLLGLARLSKRSLAAVVTFFASALLTSRLAPFSPSTSSTLAYTSTSLSLSTGGALAILALAPLLSLPPLFTSRSRPESYHARFHAFLLGMTFSIGLALAGMTRPSKVLAFFDAPLPFLPSPPPGAVWDPSLAMVAIGGLLPNMAVWQAVKGWKNPLKAERWSVPRGGDVDATLVLGSAAFGIGWGLLGCASSPTLFRCVLSSSKLILDERPQDLSRPAPRRPRRRVRLGHDGVRGSVRRERARSWAAHSMNTVQ